MSAADPSVIQQAATWLADGGAKQGRAVVPQLRDKFNFSASDACAAIREANLINARRTDG